MISAVTLARRCRRRDCRAPLRRVGPHDRHDASDPLRRATKEVIRAELGGHPVRRRFRLQDPIGSSATFAQPPSPSFGAASVRIPARQRHRPVRRLAGRRLSRHRGRSAAPIDSLTPTLLVSRPCRHGSGAAAPLPTRSARAFRNGSYVISAAVSTSSPEALLVAGDDLDRSTRRVRPELTAKVGFTAWSGEGRVRHPVFFGLREDKAPAEVMLEMRDPVKPRRTCRLR